MDDIPEDFKLGTLSEAVDEGGDDSSSESSAATATHLSSTPQLGTACADGHLPDDLDGESLGDDELADLADDGGASDAGSNIKALESNLVSVNHSINWEMAAARGLNFAWLFSG